MCVCVYTIYTQWSMFSYLLCTVALAGEEKQAEVQAARTAGDMWKAIGKDSWVVVPIASTSRPGTLPADAHCLAHTSLLSHCHVLCLQHCLVSTQLDCHVYTPYW